MQKISEKVDISNKVLEIDIDSPVFEGMLSNLNEAILRTVEKVFSKEFASGEITLKLGIGIVTGYKQIPKTDPDTGDIVLEEYKYRKPVFEHKVTNTLKKQFKSEGTFEEERAIKFENEKFIAVPLENPQMRFEDYET